VGSPENYTFPGNRVYRPKQKFSVYKPTKNYPISPTTIVANIAQCGTWNNKNFLGKVAGENSNKLWILVRTIDKLGSGKAYLDLKVCSKTLGCSYQQIKRYLESSLKLGFFRKVIKIRPGIVLVYYSSTIKVALNLGLKDLGAIAHVPIAALKNLRQYATKICLLANQHASEFRQKSRKLAGTILDPVDALRPCGIAARGILFRTSRYLIVQANIQLVGGSQKTAAKKLGRSTVTVNSHVANLSPVEKRQIAIADRDNWLEVGRNSLEHKPNLGLFKLDNFPVPLKSYCSIYSLPEIELIPQKYLRRKFKMALRQQTRESNAVLQKTTLS
jgi:hypothetical protein